MVICLAFFINSLYFNGGINTTTIDGPNSFFNDIKYIIPLTFAPIVLYVISKGAFELGLVEVVNTDMSWTHPVLFNAYKLTGSFFGFALQVINIIVGVLIYKPFVEISDNMSKRERQVAYDKLKNTVFSGNLKRLDLSSGTDSMGEISIFLGEELKEIIESRVENSAWNKEVENDITMSINVSTKQLTDNTFAGYIIDIIKKVQCQPK